MRGPKEVDNIKICMEMYLLLQSLLLVRPILRFVECSSVERRRLGSGATWWKSPFDFGGDEYIRTVVTFKTI